MSADAKLWSDDGWLWFGVNDLRLVEPEPLCWSSLHEAIEETEKVFGGRHMRWLPFEYENGLGLKGYEC